MMIGNVTQSFVKGVYCKSSKQKQTNCFKKEWSSTLRRIINNLISSKLSPLTMNKRRGVISLIKGIDNGVIVGLYSNDDDDC